MSPLTDVTQQKGIQTNETYKQCDVLMLEFGGTNQQFYAKDWANTLKMIKKHKGEIVFINDDPDLPFLWNLLPNENWSRWTIAVNAVNLNGVREILKCPSNVKLKDYPMHANMSFAEPKEHEKHKLVYIGRPNGRAKYLEEFLKSANLEISGKSNEWSDYQIDVIENPLQRMRRAFYAMYAGCLAIYDKKHAICGWRTGRAYHALYAGVPVYAPKGNAGLNWCTEVNTHNDIDKYAILNNQERAEIWQKQVDAVLKDKAVLC